MLQKNTIDQAVHWITGRVGICDAIVQNVEVPKHKYFIINVANDLHKGNSDMHCRLPYDTIPVYKLNAIATKIDMVINRLPEIKVIVHCVGGMERSPLAVAWWLHKRHKISLDEAYGLVKQGNPHTIDRIDWIVYDY